MFGELIGVWAATVWQQMGSPRCLNLIELGPGRGTLMADVLRAAKALPDFRAAISMHLVETSPVLRAQQEKIIANAAWHTRVEDVPDGPIIAIANEFTDALPVDQFVRAGDRWYMRMVGVVDDRIAFAVSPDPMPGVTAMSQASDGDILEVRHDRPLALLAERIARQNGAALVIDYGHLHSSCGDTLQAMRAHQFVDPLSQPGEADLTTQVDFAALARSARKAGVATHGPVTQGMFLRRLGIEQRAARLKSNATLQQAADIDTALARLTAPDQMGDLFKVLAFAHPALGALPGFDVGP